MLHSPVTVKGMCISLGICTGIDNPNKIIWIQNFEGIESAHSFNKHTKDLRISTKAEIEKAKDLLNPYFDFSTESEEEISSEDLAFIDYDSECKCKEEPEEIESESEAYIDYLCNRWEDAHEHHLIELHF